MRFEGNHVVKDTPYPGKAVPLLRKQRALKPDSPSLEHTGAVGLGCIPCAIAVSEGPPSVTWLQKDLDCNAEQALKLVSVPPGNISVKPLDIFASTHWFCLIGHQAGFGQVVRSKPEGEQDVILQAAHETTEPGLFRHK